MITVDVSPVARMGFVTFVGILNNHAANGQSVMKCPSFEQITLDSSAVWMVSRADFLKEEPSKCENIWWLEIEQKCLEMENPDSY
ncbi:MAG: hypothetical protein GTO18_18365 [Anaerolineales bacterium]|nr:hypothetical protein [Anaerolineales bacterium]